MQNNPALSGLALVVKKYGVRIPGGAYAVFISDQDAKDMTPDGVLEEERDETRKGTILRYIPNPTIEGSGGFVEETPVSVWLASAAKEILRVKMVVDGDKRRQDLW